MRRFIAEVILAFGDGAMDVSLWLENLGFKIMNGGEL